MSLSKEEREANLKLALGLLLDALGDLYTSEMYFSESEEEFEDIYATTWTDLKRRRWIRDVSVMEEERYRLTEYGWREGIILLEKHKDIAFREKLGKLCAAMKGFVKGRRDNVIADVEDISSKSGLPSGFVQNVIDSHILEICLNVQGAEWVNNRRMYDILIPLDFGLERL